MQNTKEKYLHILEHESMNKEAWNNLGELYFKENDFIEAQICFENAIDIDGNFASALYNLALVYLYKGNYKKGFEFFEYRCLANGKRNNFSIKGQLPIEKRLNRLDKLNGKTLYIYQETDYRAGVSDYIFLARFLPMLKKFDCKIIMDIDKSLISLFENKNFIINKFGEIHSVKDGLPTKYELLKKEGKYIL